MYCSRSPLIPKKVHVEYRCAIVGGLTLSRADASVELLFVSKESSHVQAVWVFFELPTTFESDYSVLFMLETPTQQDDRSVHSTTVFLNVYRGSLTTSSYKLSDGGCLVGLLL